MTKKAGVQDPPIRKQRRRFTEEFRREAVQMMLDGHAAPSVAERPGLSGTRLLYRWKREKLQRTGPVATSLEARVRELEIELHRVERERDILKKSAGNFRPTRVADVYAAINAIVQGDAWPTAAVCDVLEVSWSAYYAWRVGGLSQREQQEAALTPLVRALFWKHRRCYGARRIADDLADLGEVCSPPRVGKTMKSEGLRAIQPKSFVPKTTNSQHQLGYSPNLILDTPEPCGVNQLWVGGIPICRCVAAPFVTWRRCWTATRETSSVENWRRQ